MAEVKTRDKMVDVLIQAGIKQVFTFPGLGITWLAPAFYDRRDEIQVILGRSEQSASIMAQAYGRMKDAPGVFMGQGPWAVTTGAFGCLEAFYSGTPMMFLACTSDYDGMGAYGVYQSMTGDYGAGDAKASIDHLCKFSALATRPDEAIFGMQMALKHCNTPRKGVGACIFRTDFVREDYPSVMKSEVYPTPNYLLYTPPYPSVEAMDKLAEMINEAKRPVVLAGFGARQSGAGEALFQLCNELGIGVVTSTNGKSIIDETSTVCAGTLGSFGGTKASHRLLAEADLVLMLGASLGADYTRFRDPGMIRPGSQKLVQVDIDPRNASWVVPVDLPITGDCKDVVEYLLAKKLDASQKEARFEWITQLKARNKYDEVMSYVTAPGKMHYVDVYNTMNRFMTADDLLVTDAGNNSIWCKHVIRCRFPGNYITPGGTGAMGWGAPAAVGVKFARPDKRVTMIAGDGGFMMTHDAVATAVQFNQPITFVVLNNSGLGMVRDNQIPNKVYCDFEYINFAEMAKGMGAQAMQVGTSDSFMDALKASHDSNKVTVIEVALDPEARHSDATDTGSLS
ncbi:MAG: thiamine pyrophosphate-binding protein [Desulfarculaceae bacterium]|nr:thiamine pyrophosphate-binding protein [Desulfarculaceae bacterium]